MIVLDASAAVAWLLDEPRSKPGLVDLVISQRILVPAHWPVEVGHAVLKALRARRTTDAHILTVARELTAFDLTIAPQIDISRFLPLLQFARQNGLTMYDAGYVDLAIAHGAALATLDNGLRNAAERLGVELAI